MIIKKSLLFFLFSILFLNLVLVNKIFSNTDMYNTLNLERKNIYIGQKYWINDNQYFICNFTNKTKVGIQTLKIQIFDVDNILNKETKNKSFEIRCRYYTVGMDGVDDKHGVFKVSFKRDYLLDLNLGSSTDWEIELDFIYKDKTFYLGDLKVDA